MQPAKGLWGIRHTRKPVDIMVQAARNLPAGTVLPMLKITISTKGITLDFMSMNKQDKPKSFFHPIDTISYGVQDMVYTRVSILSECLITFFFCYCIAKFIYLYGLDYAL